MRGAAPIWNHAGSWSFRRFESFRGAKARSAAFAVLISLRTHGGRVLALWPHVGGDQDVREKLVGWDCDSMPGRIWLMIASVTKAQLGREGERSR